MKHGKKLLIYFISLEFFLFCAVTAVTAQTPQQIAKNAFRATVILVMEDAEGQPSLGSGFFVGDGQIATNYMLLKVPQGATGNWSAKR